MGIKKKDTVVVLSASAAFLVFQSLVVGLIPAQVLMVALFLLLFFAHEQSRRLAVALLPFVVFEVCYDWMRLCPNYMVNDIDVRGLYDAETAIFGIATADGSRQTICEYFYTHHSAAADLVSGLAYLCWVPGPMALGLWLYFTGHRREYLYFAMAFLVVNWVGFAIYYIHPAAPPWYVISHGFEAVVGTPGSAAGLERFDSLVGVPVFSSIYVNNSNIFAAVPSLHSAYMLVATIYAVRCRFHDRHGMSVGQGIPGRNGILPLPWWVVAVCVVITLGIWFAAVYTCHHYIIDVLLGIATAFAGVWLFECVLMRWKPLHRFMKGYERYVGA